MTPRRDFIRQGALWVAGAVIFEEPIKRLWAFPNNPASTSTTLVLRAPTDEEYRRLMPSWVPLEDIWRALAREGRIV